MREDRMATIVHLSSIKVMRRATDRPVAAWAENKGASEFSQNAEPRANLESHGQITMCSGGDPASMVRWMSICDNQSARRVEVALRPSPGQGEKNLCLCSTALLPSIHPHRWSSSLRARAARSVRRGWWAKHHTRVCGWPAVGAARGSWYSTTAQKFFPWPGVLSS